MSLLMDLPPGNKQNVFPLYAMHESPVASSADGQKLLQLWEEVNSQWHGRTSLSEFPQDNESDFRHVPFRTIGKIKVRFRKAIPMTPRRIEVEEGGSE